jgi:hypothetical protein
MSCCGQKRLGPIFRPSIGPAAGPASLRHERPPTTARAPATPEGGMVALRSIPPGGVFVLGPATGRQYEFSAVAPVQMVDTRDAPALLRTSWFRQA